MGRRGPDRIGRGASQAKLTDDPTPGRHALFGALVLDLGDALDETRDDLVVVAELLGDAEDHLHLRRHRSVVAKQRIAGLAAVGVEGTTRERQTWAEDSPASTRALRNVRDSLS